jgi:hypothetical protein
MTAFLAITGIDPQAAIGMIGFLAIVFIPAAIDKLIRRGIGR